MSSITSTPDSPGPAPKPIYCTRPGCVATRPLVPTRVGSVSVTGVETRLWLCLDCQWGAWLRRASDRPGVHLKVDEEASGTALVRECLRALGEPDPGPPERRPRSGIPKRDRRL